jgi:hypothetical protein
MATSPPVCFYSICHKPRRIHRKWGLCGGVFMIPLAVRIIITEDWDYGGDSSIEWVELYPHLELHSKWKNVTGSPSVTLLTSQTERSFW